MSSCLSGFAFPKQHPEMYLLWIFFTPPERWLLLPWKFYLNESETGNIWEASHISETLLLQVADDSQQRNLLMPRQNTKCQVLANERSSTSFSSHLEQQLGLNFAFVDMAHPTVFVWSRFCSKNTNSSWKTRHWAGKTLELQKYVEEKRLLLSELSAPVRCIFISINRV